MTITRRILILGAFTGQSFDTAGMAALPGGTFRMGSDERVLLKQFPGAGEGLRSMLLAETPAHQETLSPFLMDRYEVTNAQFQRFVHARPDWRKARVSGDYLKDWDGDQFRRGAAKHPVVYITWDAAVAYAEWAGKRLPTEAEWEFAVRGGMSDPLYPWGDEQPNPDRANYGASGRHGPVAGGSYPPNQYGVYDLAGNVWEFCLDEWQPRYPLHARKQSKLDVQRMLAASAVPFVGFRCVRDSARSPR